VQAVSVVAANTLPRHPETVLTAGNLRGDGQLTGADVDLGGLSRVVSTVIDGEAVLYGEFLVEAQTAQYCSPAQVRAGGSGLSGMVEDWQTGEDGTLTLSAYVYVHTPEHGPLGITLGQALQRLNTIRAQCLDRLSLERSHDLS
jgi:hypothetical protein